MAVSQHKFLSGQDLLNKKNEMPSNQKSQAIEILPSLAPNIFIQSSDGYGRKEEEDRKKS